MRTFLAILRDSYKEAVSGWLLQTMMILAVLFMVFILSLSYRHVPPEEAITKQFNILNIVYQNNTDLGKPNFKVENFKQTTAGSYWRSDYQFEVVLRCPDEASLKKAMDMPGFPSTATAQTHFMKEVINFKEIEGKVVKATPPNEHRIGYVSHDTNVEDGMSWPSYPKILFGIELDVFRISPRSMVYRLEKNIFGDFGMLAGLIISVIVTAGFIPNILRKGALDLYISKPLGRAQLLLMKYFGGLVYVVLLGSFTIFGIWVVIGLKTGVWSSGFLMMIPVTTFYFALLYAISTLAAVLTRNNLATILITLFVWALVTGVGYAHESVEQINEAGKKRIIEVKKQQGEAGASEEEIKATQPIDSIWENALFGVRRTLPRTYDVDKLSGRMIAQSVLSESEYKAKEFDTELGVSWPEVLIVSVLQIALFLGLSIFIVSKRDG